MLELLAPAGDFECLKAAVLNGADAVYIGGKEFSARQFAGNFEREEIIEAVRFCHSYNTKVYVTVNTLYKNNELISALDYASFLYEVGVDALIIQDIGFLKLLREYIPEFEIHGSTQMTVHNVEAVNLLYDLGVKRVVVSRELSIEEIRHIVKNTKAEIEVFAHGALCISFSGQCLFSSMIGGRSGNRGRCAQPCRLIYSLDGKMKDYYLSPKDLWTLNIIDELVDTGVVSLKIEGRMKRPEYVATVVSIYKKALKGKINEKDIQDLIQIFNRGGFTNAFLKGREGFDMMSYGRPKNWGTYLGRVLKSDGKFVQIYLEGELNVGDGIEIFNKDIGLIVTSIIVNGKHTKSAKKGEIVQIYLEGAKKGDLIYKSYDVNLMNRAIESYKGKDIKRIPIFANFTANLGDNTKLIVENKEGIKGRAITDPPEIAIKSPISKEKIEACLNKTKDTPFYFEKIDIDIDSNINLPLSKINNLRREAIENLIDNFQNKKDSKIINIKFKSYEKEIIPKIAVKTGRIDIAKSCLDAGCDILFFGGDNLRINSGSIEDGIYFKDKNIVFPWYPEIILEEFEDFKKQALKLKSLGICRALCGNLGLYSYLKDIGYNVYLDRGFNIFNSFALDVFDNIGGIISPELNIKQIKDLISKTNNTALINVYGRTKLMVSRQCIIGSSMGNGKLKCPNLCESKIHFLKDRKGEEFLVLTDYNCKSHIYNSKILCMIEHMKDIIKLNASYIVLEFLDESPKDAALTVEAFKEGIEKAIYKEFDLTNTMIKLIDRLQGKITKGHFYRGVD